MRYSPENIYIMMEVIVFRNPLEQYSPQGIPNLLPNYPTKLHEIMCTNITPEHTCRHGRRCAVVKGVEHISTIVSVNI